jgi:hypothetical protein
MMPTNKKKTENPKTAIGINIEGATLDGAEIMLTAAAINSVFVAGAETRMDQETIQQALNVLIRMAPSGNTSINNTDVSYVGAEMGPERDDS